MRVDAVNVLALGTMQRALCVVDAVNFVEICNFESIIKFCRMALLHAIAAAQHREYVQWHSPQ